MARKIKVNLSYEDYQTIMNDMRSFEFIKADNSVNKNKFMNQLFINYYEDYQKQLEGKYSKIEAFLSKKDKEVVDGIMDIFFEKEKSLDTYFDNSISFNLTNDTELLFEEFEYSSLHNQTISAYFRNLIHQYAGKAEDEREKIVFKKIFQSLNHAINRKKRIIVSIEKTSMILDPYLIASTKEQLYNYLLGIQISKTNSRHIKSIKLSKIDKVIELPENTIITSEEKEYLDKTNLYGAQFPYETNTESIVKLTREGKRLYNSMYLHRPIPYKVEGDLFYFCCSEIQISFYFFKFGEEAEILKPENIRKQFYYRYNKARKLYLEKKEP